MGTSRSYLKPSLSRDDSAFNYLGTDITFLDLQKKNRVGATLLNGWQLLDMAKQGLRDYRKALAFASDKWDVKKCQPIESGTNVDDLIDYVRCRMYLSTQVVTIGDEEEEDNIIETEMMNKMNKSKQKNVPKKGQS